MSDLKVPKIEKSVVVEMHDSSSMEGTIFLTRATAMHAGRERVIELLNERDLFFPILSGTKVHFLRKSSIVMVKMSAEFGMDDIDPDKSFRALLTRFPVKVDLVNGNHVSGDLLFMPGAAAEPRLLDLLNHADTFVPLAYGEHICYISIASIAAVTQNS